MLIQTFLAYDTMHKTFLNCGKKFWDDVFCCFVLD